MSHIVLLKLVDLNRQSVINYLLAYALATYWQVHWQVHWHYLLASAPDPSAPALDMDSLLTDVLFLNAWSISKI